MAEASTSDSRLASEAVELSDSVYAGADTTPVPYTGTGLQLGRTPGLKLSAGALAQWDAGVNSAITEAASKTDVHLTREQEIRLMSGQTMSDVYGDEMGEGQLADARLAMRRSAMGLQGPGSAFVSSTALRPMPLAVGGLISQFLLRAIGAAATR